MTGPSPEIAPHLLSALRCQRLSPAAWQAQAAAVALGGLGWGAAVAAVAGLAALDVPVLSPQGPRVDAWLGSGPLHRGRTGAVAWQADADWVFGQVDTPEADADLAGTTRRAYADVFAALRDSGRPHLLRLWNYLPRINADGGGLERYRQFNIGRQQAFIAAGHDAFESAPAACALGTPGGGLGIRFLAGRTAPRPIENPRQVPAWRYSPAFGPRSPTFSRAALADAGGGQLALFVSGTASIVGEDSVHAGDVRAQVHETLLNLQAVLDAAAALCTATFTLAELCCVVYVRHAADAAAVRKAFAAGVGALAPAAVQAVVLQADICRADLLVEIEGHGFAKGVLR
jgi:chorismate lyase / 3-hydroxybenzoate synthase